MKDIPIYPLNSKILHLTLWNYIHREYIAFILNYIFKLSDFLLPSYLKYREEVDFKYIPALQ